MKNSASIRQLILLPAALLTFSVPVALAAAVFIYMLENTPAGNNISAHFGQDITSVYTSCIYMALLVAPPFLGSLYATYSLYLMLARWLKAALPDAS